MGLAVEVGILSDLLQHDIEGAKSVAEHFAEINDVLTASGLNAHTEPTDCVVWSADGFGYSGLHSLREVAGHVWKGKPIPQDTVFTGQETPNSDDLFNEGLPFVLEENKQPWFTRLLRRGGRKAPPPFSHLVIHSDAQGYYVPIDFPLPLIPKNMRDETAYLWPLGSVQRLRGELHTLIKSLEIPDGLSSNDDSLMELLEAEANAPRISGHLWEAQPVATYSALILREACEASIETGAAIAFV